MNPYWNHTRQYQHTVFTLCCTISWDGTKKQYIIYINWLPQQQTTASTDTKKWFLTSAAAHILRHDATEVPETWLTAVTLQSPDTRFAGALTSGWVTCLLVGAVDITLTGTWGKQNNPNVTFSFHSHRHTHSSFIDAFLTLKEPIIVLLTAAEYC